MIRIIDTRIVIEKIVSKQKFYPKLIDAETTYSYPFSIPYARIKIALSRISDSGSSVTTVGFDDLIKLQVSCRYKQSEKIQWIDIFSGRIQTISREFSNSNFVEIVCVGHEIETTYALIDSFASGAVNGVKTYTGVDAREIIKELAGYNNKLSRITFDSNYQYTMQGTAQNGGIVTEYQVTAYQQTMQDVISDLEKISGQKWYFRTIPIYDSSDNFVTAKIMWWRFEETTPIVEYKIIEGTRRLLGANFEVNGEDVKTTYKIFGATKTDGSYYQGTGTNTGAVTMYGNRYETDTYNWAKSDSACSTIAYGLAMDTGYTSIAGQVKLIGTPMARIGDLVYTKILSLESNGNAIDGNYTVYRVQHNISQTGFTTTLDLGNIKKDAYDYMDRRIVKPLKVCKRNFKKG